MEDLKLVYITTRDPAQALAIGRALVDRRLAACVNILSGMISVYRWQGRVEESHEAVLVAKTTADLVEALLAAVRELHTYALPCALVLPIEGGNPAYLAWLRSEVAQAGDQRPTDPAVP